MAEPFIGEIRPFAFNFPPRGWALCSGQLLPINQNQALFSLLGTTYGGNGTTNFALPNLNARVAVGEGQGNGLAPHSLGETGGQSAVGLNTSNIPAHNHGVATASSSTSTSPANALPGPSVHKIYDPAGNAALAPDALAQTGGSQAHDNMQPTLCINYSIALIGIFPSRN